MAMSLEGQAHILTRVTTEAVISIDELINEVLPYIDIDIEQAKRIEAYITIRRIISGEELSDAGEIDTESWLRSKLT